MMSKRFHFAMAAYVILGALAAATLDGDVRLVVLIVLGGLAVKTVVAVLQQRAAEREKESKAE